MSKPSPSLPSRPTLIAALVLSMGLGSLEFKPGSYSLPAVQIRRQETAGH
jgi:hypothetical protein